MALTEAPPPQTQGTEERPRKAHRGRASRLGVYDELGGYDLLHVIEDLEDERARVQLREKIYIALILHVLLFLFLYYSPRIFPVTRVREAPLNDKQDMTVLTLPPDLLKHLKPDKPVPPANKDSRAPVPSRKTLRELERHPTPPAPKPAPQAKQQPAPPQVAREQAPPAPRPRPAPPPIPHNQSAELNAPRPQQNMATSTPSIAQSMHEAQNEPGTFSGGGEPATNAPSRQSNTTGPVDILSNTEGVNFDAYIQRVIYDTKRAWYPIIPEVARPPISKQGRVLIRFKIMADGTVRGMTLEGPSGDISLDRAAWGGILGAQPFPPLPKKFKGPFLELRFYFLYNDQGNQ